MGTPKHWKHVFFEKGRVFREKKGPCQECPKPSTEWRVFLRKKGPCQECLKPSTDWGTKSCTPDHIFPGNGGSGVKKKVQAAFKVVHFNNFLWLKLFFWHQIHYFQDICDLVDRPGDIHQMPENPFLLKTGPYRCYRRENTTNLMEITFRIQWDHSRITNQFFQNKKV